MHLQVFLSGNQDINYPSTLEQLKNYDRKLDNIIALETDCSSFLMSLYQQKQQLAMLISIVEKLISDKATSNTSNFISVKLPSDSIQNQITQPKRKRDENEKIMVAVKNTIEQPKINGFSDVVGLHDIKKNLRSLVILSKTQPQLFLNRRTGNSILLFGPPGTGKTRLVHALAAEANAAFHCISASDVLSHYVGQTEKTIKSLFQHLKTNNVLSVLFIDEIDGLCRRRTEDEHEHTRRIKTELMCQISATEDCKHMFIICATNCPWDLDVAILRRFQKRIYVPLPNQSERLEFFKYFTKGIEFEEDEPDWLDCVQTTEGYSGSDLSNVIQCALIIPLDELEDTKIWKHTDDGYYTPILREQDFTNVICSELRNLPANSVKARKMRMCDVRNSIDNVTLTVSLTDVKKYECFNGS